MQIINGTEGASHKSRGFFCLRLFWISACFGIGLFTVPAYSARTILTDVARPGPNEKVRRFVISGVTDARCLISSSDFESPATKKELAGCRQKLMTHASVIEVGAGLANAVEKRIRQTAISNTAVKAEVAKRLAVYDACIRNEIGPRQTLPLEGLAQLCAVSRTGSPTEGMKSLVIQEKADTRIVVYDFDASVFDSLIEQENGKAAPWARSEKISSPECPARTCNRCKAVGFSSNYVAVSKGRIAMAFPLDAFPEGNKQLPARAALKKNLVSEVVQGLKEVSPALSLDDIWHVKDKKLGAFLCIVCPQGYVSNGIDACVKNGCDLGGVCQDPCLPYQYHRGTKTGGTACQSSCDILKQSDEEEWLAELRQTISESERYEKIAAIVRQKLKDNKAVCEKDSSQSVSTVYEYSDLFVENRGCEPGQVKPTPGLGGYSYTGCQQHCDRRKIYAGSMDFGSCPGTHVDFVIDQLFAERGRVCEFPITRREVLERIAESGFNCAAYATGKDRNRIGADKNATRPVSE